MFEAELLGLPASKIRAKVINLRSREARNHGIDIPRMEVVYGWDADEMATSLVRAIKHERCRGPRCGRVLFRDLVATPTHLGLITGDIIDPGSEPVFCLNFGWACEQDNKGDHDTSLSERARKLVAEGDLVFTRAVETRAVETRFVQTSIFDLLEPAPPVRGLNLDAA